jgi:hypothetical protein
MSIGSRISTRVGDAHAKNNFHYATLGGWLGAVYIQNTKLRYQFYYTMQRARDTIDEPFRQRTAFFGFASYTFLKRKTQILKFKNQINIARQPLNITQKEDG